MSKESAAAIKYVLAEIKRKNLDNKMRFKTSFIQTTGISRTSLYKYLRGEPIHPLKAKAIVEGVKRVYGLKIPIEKLID